MVAVAGALLIFGNQESSGTPLAAFLAIIIATRVSAPSLKTSSSSSLFRAAVLFLCSGYVIGSLVPNALGISKGLYAASIRTPHAPRMEAPLLDGFVPVGADEAYTNYVNDGLRLLGKHRRSGETIMCLDFSDPFSYGLAIPPATGGATGIDYLSTFDDMHKQSAEQLFGHADLVMLPKIFTDAGLTDSIPRIYGSYLAAHFRPVSETPCCWRLYRRN